MYQVLIFGVLLCIGISGHVLMHFYTFPEEHNRNCGNIVACQTDKCCGHLIIHSASRPRL